MEKTDGIILLVCKTGHLREALLCLINTLPAISRVVCADSGLLALKALGALRPALVLIANGLPADEGPELVRQVKRALPHTACLVLAEGQEQIDQALAAGAEAALPSRAHSGALLALLENLLPPPNRPDPA